ncbi:AraC family transcriptional regulator [Pseudolabrys sp. FHR47]|uniref:AraC family transcriptional regulator n=1 Tax=Pseudolabrys sp. FHR47 TaxID=2562284 RepID=UPI0010BEAA0C|nr:AraC family transcriptional regulator [Pseudolabrys sp. FHR47]
MTESRAIKTDDPLSDALSSIQMESTVLAIFGMSAPWAIEHPKLDAVISHIILDGETWCYGDELPTVRVRKGDIIVFPRGKIHYLASEPGLAAKPVASLLHSVGHSIWRTGHQYTRPIRFSSEQAGSDCIILDVVSGIHESRRNPLVASLPGLLHVPAADHGLLPALELLLDIIASDESSAIPGYAAAAGRIADLAFIQSVRAFLRTRAPEARGWLSGLLHPKIGRALQAIHRNPGDNWTVATLAAQANMSRAPFSRVFFDCVGQTPMHFVTEWRMCIAVRRLGAGVPIGLVSEELGYASPVTFSRTFRRVMGVSPSDMCIRRQIVRV